MHTNLNKIIIMLLVFSFTVSVEAVESIWDRAKKNEAPTSLKDKNLPPQGQQLPFSLEKEYKPILIKVMIPWDKERLKATIYYKGGTAPYRVGDFVPPYYTLTKIEPNHVQLKCSAIKKENIKKCISTLSFSGVFNG